MFGDNKRLKTTSSITRSILLELYNISYFDLTHQMLNCGAVEKISSDFSQFFFQTSSVVVITADAKFIYCMSSCYFLYLLFGDSCWPENRCRSFPERTKFEYWHLQFANQYRNIYSVHCFLELQQWYKHTKSLDNIILILWSITFFKIKINRPNVLWWGVLINIWKSR